MKMFLILCKVCLLTFLLKRRKLLSKKFIIMMFMVKGLKNMFF